MERIRRSLLSAFALLVGFAISFVNESAAAPQNGVGIGVNAPVVPANQMVRTTADGTLHDCQVVSLDRTIAVGDLGLILLSVNGGKNWTVQNHRSNSSLYGVSFRSETDGMIVGGSIEPYSHRSTGTVLSTSDGGKTWRSIDSQLPRLLGIESIGTKHWIAWGDWSPLFQSALFESFDDGSSWSAVPIPCGPLRAMAVRKDDRDGSSPNMLLIDRLGRVYRTQDRQNFQSIDLPTTPYSPLLFCEHDGNRWWLGGENGQLLSSTDGQRWQSSTLPGTSKDHELITLRTFAARGQSLWVAGNPGTVVWKSTDAGRNWETVPTGNTSPIHSLHAFNDQVVVGCGPLASVSISRNAGQAWWLQHQSGSRVGTLNLASTSDCVAWDAMAYLHEEARRTVGSIVIHEQGIEKKSSHLPDSAARNCVASELLGLASCTTWSGFPISANSKTPRISDLEHYRNLGSLHAPPESLLVRKLLQELRVQNPDLVITDCPLSGTEIHKKLADAVELAVAWAPKREFQLYTSESGIPNTPWSVQRILFRGTKPGLSFQSSMLLKKSGTILGELLVEVNGIARDERIFSTPTKSFTYRTMGSKFSTLKEPLEGMTLSAQTQRFEKPVGVGRPTTIMATAIWFNTKDFISTTNNNSFVRDRAWEERLQLAMKNVEPATRGPVLLEIAEKNRLVGNWNCWSSALEMLLSEEKETPIMEAAYRELLSHLGSAEVQQLVQNQLQHFKSRTADESGQVASTVPVSSPFAKHNDQSWVQQAAYVHSPRLIPITNTYGLPEVKRLLTKFPQSWAYKRVEPEWGWLIASRFRSDQFLKRGPIIDHGEYSTFWPRTSPNLLHWQQVVNEEQQLLRKKSTQATNLANSKVWPKTDVRPHLDGLRNEPTWDGSMELTLKDPWGQSPHATRIWLTRDDEFLYLFSRSESNSGFATQPAAERRRDSVQPDQEQIRFRFDLDRDYCSWFEFAWNRRGETSDQCNDMLTWDPDWYIAVVEHDRGWQAEIAIPLTELVPEERRTMFTDWAINAIHIEPNAGTRTLAPAISDKFQDDQWSIISME